ncbi:glutathione S-transferase family protein [Phenylobacterium sp.]|uniref:glutathione S-transferase family protein n=1 Tax=Phenylobacterium sp. TaxID=1871053 RepID=UPI0035AE4F49
MLALYRFPGATCAAKVLMALHEKGVSFEDKVIGREDLASDWYRRLNPNGVVPTITHQGAVIIESSVILNYVEDAFSGPPLRPASALARARMNYWLRLTDDALESLGVLTYAIVMRRLYQSQTPAQREAQYAAIADPRRRAVRRSVIEYGLEAPEADYAFKTLFGLREHASRAVREADFLAGDELSLADIALAPFIARMQLLGLLDLAERDDTFDAWWARVQERPSFQRGVVDSMSTGAVDAARAAVALSREHLARFRAAAVEAAPGPA